MNNIFSIKRFLLLLRRQWIGFGKIYLMSIIIVLGVFTAFYGYNLGRFANTYDSVNIESAFSFRPFLFVFLGLIYISVIANSYFLSLANKSKAAFELLVPASSLEKFFAGLFYTAVCPVAVYFLIFTAVDYAFVSYTKSTYASLYHYVVSQTGRSMTTEDLLYFSPNNFPRQLLYFLFVPFLLHAVFLLGSLSFKDNQFVKTALTLFTYIAIVVFVVMGVGKYFSSTRVLIDQTQTEEIEMLRTVLIIGIVVTLTIWSIAYLRLKEKEV